MGHLIVSYKNVTDHKGQDTKPEQLIMHFKGYETSAALFF